MADVTINRAVTIDEVATLVQQGLDGPDVKVKHEGDHLAVQQGYWKRAKVTVQPGSGTTAVQVKTSAPPGLIGMAIAMVVNQRSFVPKVAAALQQGS